MGFHSKYSPENRLKMRFDHQGSVLRIQATNVDEHRPETKMIADGANSADRMDHEARTLIVN